MDSFNQHNESLSLVCWNRSKVGSFFWQKTRFIIDDTELEQYHYNPNELNEIR